MTVPLTLGKLKQTAVKWRYYFTDSLFTKQIKQHNMKIMRIRS